MHKYNEEFIEKAFELIPEANFIVVDIDNRCYGSDNIFYLSNNEWESNIGSYYYLGHVIPTCSWKDSLRGRKWVPKRHENYYYPNPSFLCKYNSTIFTDSHSEDVIRLKNNLVYRTKEEAILACEKMLAAVRK